MGKNLKKSTLWVAALLLGGSVGLAENVQASSFDMPFFGDNNGNNFNMPFFNNNSNRRRYGPGPYGYGPGPYGPGRYGPGPNSYGPGPNSYGPGPNNYGPGAYRAVPSAYGSYPPGHSGSPQAGDTTKNRPKANELPSLETDLTINNRLLSTQGK